VIVRPRQTGTRVAKASMGFAFPTFNHMPIFGSTTFGKKRTQQVGCFLFAQS